jgi:hypothetical protein
MKTPTQKKSVFQLFGLIVIALSLTPAGGCQSGEESVADARGESKVEAALADQDKVNHKSSVAIDTTTAQGSSSKNSNNEDDENYVVPGINFQPPADDAVADGWQTEQYASAAGSQLKQLALHFAAAKESPPPALEEIVQAEVKFQSLRPDDVEPEFQDAAFTIRRGKEDSTSDALLNEGIESFRTQLTDLLGFVANPRDVKTKVKVFKVDHDDSQLVTSAYMQTWGNADDGTFQSNATWDCVWKIDETTITLQSLKVRDYLDVVGANATNGGPMFADCTESILGSTPAFRDQLVPSMDQWLHVLEYQYHINIGGWEGLCISDVNGDGLDDLYVCQPGGLPNRLFIQNEDGTCRDTSKESGTDWLNQSHGSVFGDLDNDGDQDLVVGVQDGLLVMSNDGAGKFSVRSGLILPAAVPYSITLADYDQDGDLDVFACCYDRRSGVNRERIFAKAIPYHDANNGGRNVLFRNEATPADPEDSKWTFRYATKQAGFDENNRRFSYAASWEDYDNDGDLDLYVANDFGRNNLYRNDGGKFKDVAKEAGVEDVSAGMSITWADYNNDGWMDIYVSNMFSSAGNRIAFQRKFQSDAGDETKKLFQRHARGNSLFENAKDGTFRDVSVEGDVTMGRWAWGSRFIDINSDGWQDLLVGNGFLTLEKPDDL